MTLHRITASKDVATILNKTDHWANLSSIKKEILDGLIKGHPTHFNLDNIDACQEEMTGLGTTHTPTLKFQLLTSGKNSCSKKIALPIHP